MFLKTIKIKNLKNLKNLKINFSQKRNLIVGDEGKGKTTLFESIFFLNFLPFYLNKDIFKNISFNEEIYSLIIGDIKEWKNKNLNWFKLKIFIQNNKIIFYKDEKLLNIFNMQLNIFSFFISLSKDNIFLNYEIQKKFFFQEILRNNLDYLEIEKKFKIKFDKWIVNISIDEKKSNIDEIKILENELVEIIFIIKKRIFFLIKNIFLETKKIFKKQNNFSFLKKYFVRKDENLFFKIDWNNIKNNIKIFFLSLRNNKIKQIDFFDFCLKNFLFFLNFKELKKLSNQQQKIVLIFLKLGAAKVYSLEINKTFLFCIDDFDILSIKNQHKILKIFPSFCQLIFFINDLKKSFFLEEKNNFILFKLI